MEKIELWPQGAPGALGTQEEDRPHLLRFPAAGTAARGAVVVCPGGGYAMRAGHEADPIAAWYQERGFHAFVLHYRVAPYAYPSALEDAQQAIRLVRLHAQEWGVDPERIALLGFSAGGHVAASAGTLSNDGDPLSDDPIRRIGCRPDALLLCYPVISMRPDVTHGGSRRNLLGERPDPELEALLSADEQVGPDTPPTFLWHTAEDEGVSSRNSLRFAMALAEHGVSYDLHVYQRGRHGIGMAADDRRAGGWLELSRSWLEDLGWGGSSR
ncbi:alpha/beta hydrolase [Paenibacillus pasadenensis]|uniref:Endo-1,4-beta-xylanase B n=1 Tax=Paenibacillus pasadenensis TaxID=217090 RepID=A0A2N5N7X1_9BACL|nr:alpha/beta hydrolase [Paenibacillus pasadenensis]PLT46425.1 Endo-1,4-beta-xylanase B precursor [Paenibacillus pasadenensis]